MSLATFKLYHFIIIWGDFWTSLRGPLGLTFYLAILVLQPHAHVACPWSCCGNRDYLEP